MGIGDKMMDQFLHIGWLIQQTESAYWHLSFSTGALQTPLLISKTLRLPLINVLREELHRDAPGSELLQYNGK